MIKTPELFDMSNQAMKNIEYASGSLPQISVGEFWWYFEGINIGQEVSKDGNMKRPCLIVKSIVQSSLVWILPLTSKIISSSVHQMQLTQRSEHGLKKESALLIYQLKCVDKKRLIEKIEGKRATKGLLKIIQKKATIVA